MPDCIPITARMVERGVEAVYAITRSNEIHGVPDDKQTEVRQLVHAVLLAALENPDGHR